MTSASRGSRLRRRRRLRRGARASDRRLRRWGRPPAMHRPHRTRRAGPGLAHRRPVGRQPDPHPAARYREWFAALPADLAAAVVEHWGPPPGSCSAIGVSTRTAKSCSRQCNPEIWSSSCNRRADSARTRSPSITTPDLPPSHHYLATYLWLRHEFRAHAVVHLGKHGNLGGCPARPSACRRRAAPTRPSATCR